VANLVCWSTAAALGGVWLCHAERHHGLDMHTRDLIKNGAKIGTTGHRFSHQLEPLAYNRNRFSMD
jgi:hypothetical protein